jgi:hypothetical protein
MGLDQYSYFVKNKQEIEDKNDEFMKLLDAGKKYTSTGESIPTLKGG